jgi:hypothetical protein
MVAREVPAACLPMVGIRSILYVFFIGAFFLPESVVYSATHGTWEIDSSGEIISITPIGGIDGELGYEGWGWSPYNPEEFEAATSDTGSHAGVVCYSEPEYQYPPNFNRFQPFDSSALLGLNLLETGIGTNHVPGLDCRSAGDYYYVIFTTSDRGLPPYTVQAYYKFQWDGSTSTSAINPGPEELSECCSSVVFLPGIKGSVLKSGSDTLWPPGILSNDIPQLALDENGESINDIQVDGVLDSFYNTPIYGPFEEFLNDLVEDEVINEWLPVAYDWRYLPDHILDEGVVTPSGTVDVLEEIESLASSSQTGKVTIVAHSMGGLMGKAIIRRLEQEGKDNLIDAFIMVGSPQLGTPQAVASMLHGDDEGIAAGFIVNASAVRDLALNMPSTYSLLPSPAYFEEIDDPTIVFDPDADFTGEWRDHWGSEISSYDSYAEFLTGQGVARQDPDQFTLRIPEIADSELLGAAENLHLTYDEYSFPEHIRVIQVAGWGRPTTRGVEYRTNHLVQSYETTVTREGDGVVVYPSAVSSDADETYYFNLFELSRTLGGDTQHRDLLSAAPLQTVIELIIKNVDVLESTYLLSSKPTLEDIDDQLVVGTHSPVILGAYDQLDNFTGIDQDQDLSAEILSFSEEIPGSAFVYSNEAQYIFLPKSGEYTFVYRGTGNGSTTVSLQNFSGNDATLIAQYSDISTTPLTSATFVLDTDTPEEVILEVDLDGDGEVDVVIQPDGKYTTIIGDPDWRGNGERITMQINAEERARLIARFDSDITMFLQSIKLQLEKGPVNARALASLEQRVRLLMEAQKLVEILKQNKNSV